MAWWLPFLLLLLVPCIGQLHWKTALGEDGPIQSGSQWWVGARVYIPGTWRTFTDSRSNPISSSVGFPSPSVGGTISRGRPKVWLPFRKAQLGDPSGSQASIYCTITAWMAHSHLNREFYFFIPNDLCWFRGDGSMRPTNDLKATSSHHANFLL